MQNIITYIELTSAVLLVIAVLLQSRGAGLSNVFGGGGEGNVYRTKRGFEKSLYWATIVLSVVFLGSALANILIRQ